MNNLTQLLELSGQPGNRKSKEKKQDFLHLKPYLRIRYDKTLDQYGFEIEEKQDDVIFEDDVDIKTFRIINLYEMDTRDMISELQDIAKKYCTKLGGFYDHRAALKKIINLQNRIDTNFEQYHILARDQNMDLLGGLKSQYDLISNAILEAEYERESVQPNFEKSIDIRYNNGPTKTLLTDVSRALNGPVYNGEYHG